MSENIVWSNRSRANLEGVKSKCAMKTWKQELVKFWAVKGKIMRKGKMGERPGVEEKGFD